MYVDQVFGSGKLIQEGTQYRNTRGPSVGARGRSWWRFWETHYRGVWSRDIHIHVDIRWFSPIIETTAGSVLNNYDAFTALSSGDTWYQVTSIYANGRGAQRPQTPDALSHPPLGIQQNFLRSF